MRAALGASAAEVPGLELVIVFGSAATGRTRYDSDLDVAVKCTSVADLDALFLALAPRLKTNRLDLVDLRRAGPLLAFEIARSGVLLFERSLGLFRQFQSLAWRRYGDSQRLRDAQKRSIQVFLERVHANESR